MADSLKASSTKDLFSTSAPTAFTQKFPPSSHKSRPISGSFTIKACAVRRRQNGWYVSIRIEDKSIPDYTTKPLKGVVKVIGCDMGITKLVHLSDGSQIENPKFSTTKKTKRTLKIRQSY
ncbi:MAG: hypothetical protein ACM65L_18220 [Microcoleus sp.]